MNRTAAVSALALALAALDARDALRFNVLVVVGVVGDNAS